MEIWDAYTRDGVLTDKKLIRGEPIGDGLYHIVCEVLVRHADGSYLCMKRAESKPAYPGYYETSAGGSATVGETPLMCIKRELFEETGIVCDDFIQVAHTIVDRSHTIYHTYVCTVDIDKSSVILQDGETVAYKWMDEDEFIEFINSDDVIQHQKQRFMPYFSECGYIK
ncbi:MAG: NUDIX hydrolase [Clostridia bacterium]|nr:NUDIX hydrolase [Clostridia bacterium]